MDKNKKYALKVIFILQLHLPSQYRYHYSGLPQYMKLNKFQKKHNKSLYFF